MSMRTLGTRLVVPLTALVVIAAGGCGPSTRQILVTGTLQTVGGPAPGPPRNVPGSVVFHSAGGRSVTAVVGSDGTFRATVPAGPYTVVGWSPRYNGPCDGVPVTVPKVGPVPPVHVYCQEA